MSDVSRSGRGRHFRPWSENLEGRSLLSVTRPALWGSAVVRDVPGPSAPVSYLRSVITGTRATDGLYGGTPTGFASYSGHGGAAPFGGVLFGSQYLPTDDDATAGLVNVSNGSALLTTTKGGDQLRLYFTGTATLTRKGQIQSWTWEGTVNSGTGRFLNATGTFTATGRATFGRGFRLDLRVAFDNPV